MGSLPDKPSLTLLELGHFTLNGFDYYVLFGLAGTALFGLARFVPVLFYILSQRVYLQVIIQPF